MITLQQKFDMFIILRYLNIHKKFTFSPQNIQIYLHNYECGGMIYIYIYEKIFCIFNDYYHAMWMYT